MVLWNRDLTYKKRLTAQERKEVARSNSTPGTIRRAQKINNLINIWIPVIICCFTDFNLFILCGAFIATDILLCTYDHLRFVVVPHFITMNMSLSDAQKRLDRLKNQEEEVNKDIQTYKATHYCGHICEKDCRYCELTYMQDDQKKLAKMILQEQQYVTGELQKIKEAEIKVDQRQSYDYTDKKEYLTKMQVKLGYFIGSHNMKFLDPVYKSVTDLINILEKKSFGYEMISNITYIHLDELQKILGQIADYDEERRAKYEPDVQRIAKALGNNIANVHDRIEQTETADVEVSIAVLLRDLIDEGEEKNV